MLCLHNITKQYVSKSEALTVLNQYSGVFTAKRSCIVGENGAGKSTLLLLVSGLLTIDAGSIEWQGYAINQDLLKTQVAIASDSIVIPEFLSAKQVLELNQYAWKTDWPEELIGRFKFNNHLHKTIDALSAGNLKKLQLICALMRNCELLLLDEPNIALDEDSVKVLWEIIKTYSGMIIVASNEPILFEAQGFELHPLHSSDDD